ncbi:hypothetical protein OUZ56_005212 [Daphnia magna]|uniref:Uncharacterized protein n=1 Tax=Daphnia magna TaxID=35525 RepID=A0ABQ9YS54_9CRUS|nr:hypothetical protein OUZ56_005212 [Daphnia magna]
MDYAALSKTSRTAGAFECCNRRIYGSCDPRATTAEPYRELPERSEAPSVKIITIHQRHLAATIRTFMKSPLEEELNHYRSLQPFPTINIDFIVPEQIQFISR